MLGNEMLSIADTASLDSMEQPVPNHTRQTAPEVKHTPHHTSRIKEQRRQPQPLHLQTKHNEHQPEVGLAATTNMTKATQDGAAYGRLRPQAAIKLRSIHVATRAQPGRCYIYSSAASACLSVPSTHCQFSQSQSSSFLPPDFHL